MPSGDQTISEGLRAVIALTAQEAADKAVKALKVEIWGAEGVPNSGLRDKVQEHDVILKQMQTKMQANRTWIWQVAGSMASALAVAIIFWFMNLYAKNAQPAPLPPQTVQQPVR